ncbi:MAG: winged helix-turn-helix domain-containing protein [Bacteroides sp.]|nr:winged helix-turn-helix domain-containing protein [Bacteroides sp.]
MLQEKAGEFAGKIWNALNGTEGMTTAQIKKAAELADKELYLGLGWLLREDKLNTEEVKGKLVVSLK